MRQDGRLKGPLHIQFVMGIKNAMPADRRSFDFFRETVQRIESDATWVAAGIGRAQLEVNKWCLEAGGPSALEITSHRLDDPKTTATPTGSSRRLSLSHIGEWSMDTCARRNSINFLPMWKLDFVC